MKVFIDHLGNSIFKILPLREESNAGLQEYIDSLLFQLNGALVTYPTLSENIDYISIVNIVGYLKGNDYSIKQCKREVFKCLHIIDKIKKDYEL